MAAKPSTTACSSKKKQLKYLTAEELVDVILHSEDENSYLGESLDDDSSIDEEEFLENYESSDESGGQNVAAPCYRQNLLTNDVSSPILTFHFTTFLYFVT